jgi:selenocysteine lyase/cysteine desulfurase
MLERLEPPFLDMRAADWVEPDRYVLRPDAIRFEEWEQAYAAKAGLSTAIDYALGWGLDSIWQRIAALGESLRTRLGDVEGVTVRDLGAVRCGIVTFTVDGVEAGELKEGLARERINVTVSPRSSTLLDSNARALPDLVRASVHYYNTDEELDRLVETISNAAPRRAAALAG